MIKRYYSDADTVISNAFKSGLLTRATGSNAGLSDVLEIFSIYAQATTSSQELSRVLIKFPISSISTDRTNGIVPNSGSVNFYLKLFNTPHSFTVPRKITLAINPVSSSWDEGYGKDIDNYSDIGICNWNTARSSSLGGLVYWNNTGGDFITGTYIAGSNLPHYTYYMESGTENLDLNITSLVEGWIAGTYGNHGIGIQLTSSIENARSSSYSKKFFGRGTEFHFKKPVIEAQWNDSLKDQRSDFYASSSLVTDNSNKLYLYNFVRGQLSNIPSIGTGKIYVKMYTDAISGSLVSASLDSSSLGGHVSTGIYSASVTINTTSSILYDRWFNSGESITFKTGSAITIKQPSTLDNYPIQQYVLSMLNLKEQYFTDEIPTFRIFLREKGWRPNVYYTSISDNPSQIIDNLYYQVRRIQDDLIVVNAGTSSINYTLCSYDVSGSYFSFDISMLQSGYAYSLEYYYKFNNSTFRKLDENFRFRVEDRLSE